MEAPGSKKVRSRPFGQNPASPETNSDANSRTRGAQAIQRSKVTPVQKKDLPGYMEFTSHLVGPPLNADLGDLHSAVDQTSIHTFGWPIAPVLHTDKLRPRATTKDSIESVVEDRGLYDYWTLDRSGHFHILTTLFEDQLGGGGKIYFDTRTNRTTELLLRTGRLYSFLGAEEDRIVACSLEYGGLKNRLLTAANQLRAFTMLERRCALDVLDWKFEESVGRLQEPRALKERVYKIIKNITEVCDFFVPSKSEAIDPIIDAFLAGRIE